MERSIKAIQRKWLKTPLSYYSESFGNALRVVLFPIPKVSSTNLCPQQTIVPSQLRWVTPQRRCMPAQEHCTAQQERRTLVQERCKAVQERCAGLRECIFSLQKAILVLQCSPQAVQQYILEELAIGRR